jgi:hypothetical protein
MAASMMKNGPHPIAFAVDKKVDDIKVAQILLKKLATDIALARMLTANISEGMSHAPGPAPTLKNERYNDSPTIANVELFFFPKKEKLVRRHDPQTPARICEFGSVRFTSR